MKIVNRCVGCSIQRETARIADVMIRNRTRLRIIKECSKTKKKRKHATKIVRECVGCLIQRETAHIADVSDVLTQMNGKLLKDIKLAKASSRKADWGEVWRGEGGSRTTLEISPSKEKGTVDLFWG